MERREGREGGSVEWREGTREGGTGGVGGETERGKRKEREEREEWMESANCVSSVVPVYIECKSGHCIMVQWVISAIWGRCRG